MSTTLFNYIGLFCWLAIFSGYLGYMIILIADQIQRLRYVTTKSHRRQIIWLRLIPITLLTILFTPTFLYAIWIVYSFLLAPITQ